MSIQEKRRFKNANVIINPISGRGKNKFSLIDLFLGINSERNHSMSSEDVANFVSSYLKENDINSKSCFTEGPGHAITLAKDAVAESVDLVVVIGGDGTINEVINGLATTNIPLGIIPMGTANVFSLEFNIPSNIEEACKKIVNGNCQKIDLGRVGKRYFGCMAGVGFDAFVIKKTDRVLKRVLGALSYILVAIKEFISYRFRPIILKIDDESKSRKGYFVIVGNTKYYGGQFFATPQADPLDGYLDVCIFRYKNIVSALVYIFNMKFGKIMSNLSTDYFKAKKISISKKGKHSIHVDGEYLCEAPVDIAIEPNALWIVK